MSQFSIIGTPLYQWESGRQLKVIPLRGMTVDSVHFSNYGDSTALVVKPKEENGHYIADIPNILLQDDQNIVVYSVNVSEDKVETIRECVFPVRKRAKPSSYVYTETEVLNYTTLAKEIEEIKKNGTGGTVSDEQIAQAVEDYLKENPVEGVETYVVTAVKDTEHDTTSIDKTNAEIYAAHKNGKSVICVLAYDGMPFILTPLTIVSNAALFSCLMRDESIGVMLKNGDLEITVEKFATTENLDEKLSKDELPEAVNAALAEAKESGAFDGKPGADGRDGKDGYTPQKGVDYFDGKDGSPGKDGNPGADGYTPVKGVDYFTPDEVQNIAEQAAGMVEVPNVGEETILFEGSAEIPQDAPVTVVEWTLPEAAKYYDSFYIELGESTPTNAPANDIRARVSICGNNLAGSTNGNGAFRKAASTWITIRADLRRRTVINATYNNEPKYNTSSSFNIWTSDAPIPVERRTNVLRVSLNVAYAGTVSALVRGYSGWEVTENA